MHQRTETDTRRLLTVPEAAKRLRCSELTLRRKIAAGVVPAYRVASERGPLKIFEDELVRSLRPVHAAGDGSLRRQGQLRPDAGDPARRGTSDEAVEPAALRGEVEP